MALEVFQTGKGPLACSADVRTGFVCLGWREVVGRSSGDLGIHCDGRGFQSQPFMVSQAAQGPRGMGRPRDNWWSLRGLKKSMEVGSNG